MTCGREGKNVIISIFNQIRVKVELSLIFLLDDSGGSERGKVFKQNIG